MSNAQVPGVQKMAVALGSPDLEVFTISIKNFTADTVSVGYQGLPGNQPQTYSNFVAIWESSVIPWTAPPIEAVPIPQNSQNGTVVFSNLTITLNTYIVGYGVGPGTSTICTSAILNTGGLTAAPTSVQIGLDFVGTSSVSVSYKTLAGYLPATNKNWIGLWRGFVSPYNAPQPLGKTLITNDFSEGSVAINGVSIGIETTYTLIYLMGGELTEAAAILTFDTASA